MKYLKLYESINGFTVNDYLNKYYDRSESFFIIDELGMTNVGLTSLDGLERVVNVEYMWIPRNELTSLKGIENLKNLKFLSCVRNQITSLKGIEHCKKLYHLGCYSNLLKNLDELKDLTLLREVNCEVDDDGNDAPNPWEFPLSKEIVNKFRIEYSSVSLKRFGTYEYQKEFLEEYPMKAQDLELIGFNEKIIEEFKDLLDFFNIKY